MYYLTAMIRFYIACIFLIPVYAFPWANFGTPVPDGAPGYLPYHLPHPMSLPRPSPYYFPLPTFQTHQTWPNDHFFPPTMPGEYVIPSTAFLPPSHHPAFVAPPAQWNAAHQSARPQRHLESLPESSPPQCVQQPEEVRILVSLTLCVKIIQITYSVK